MVAYRPKPKRPRFVMDAALLAERQQECAIALAEWNEWHARYKESQRRKHNRRRRPGHDERRRERREARQAMSQYERAAAACSCDVETLWSFTQWLLQVGDADLPPGPLRAAFPNTERGQAAFYAAYAEYVELCKLICGMMKKC